ncbi:MAG TPA: hypothetical protein VJY37_02260 [Anaerovoracaceae bacterium]|nr:hypothetical protein [Anaerovoracaceae bacterium]
MPLFILGFFFVVGLFAYYLFSTSSDKYVAKKKPDVKKEGNVIYLQREDKASSPANDKKDDTDR